MTGHWEVHYEPYLWWAQNDGVFVCADSVQELIAEMVSVAAWLKAGGQ